MGRSTFRKAGLCLPGLILCACGGGPPTENPSPPPPPTAPVATLTLDHTSAALVPTQTVRLTATPKDGQGDSLSGRTITWTSSATGVANVDATGLVTAAAAGTATVQAASEGKTANASITVRDGAVIGTAGGQATSSSGRVTVVVPNGALAGFTTITITANPAPPADPKLLAGSAYDFGPDGTQFTVPVTLRIRYEPGQLPAGVTPAQLQLAKLNGTTWTPLAGSSVDQATATVSAPTSSFSSYAIISTALVASLRMTPARADPWRVRTLGDGGSVNLGVQAFDLTGLPLPGAIITYASGNELLLDVNATGKVTGRIPQPGFPPWDTVTVSAMSGQIKVSTTLLLVHTYGWARVAAGGEHACGLARALPSLWGLLCWGDNSSGQLGIGTADADLHPFPEFLDGIPGMDVAESPPKAVAAGSGHTCIVVGGKLSCWGRNDHGQLGLGDLLTRLRPAQVTTLPSPIPFDSWVQVGADGDRTCALSLRGYLSCWGQWDGINHSFPVPQLSGEFVQSMSESAGRVCAVTANSDGYCSGQAFDENFQPFTAMLPTPDEVTGYETGQRDFFVVTTPVKWRLLSAGFPACGVDLSFRVLCFEDGATSEHMGRDSSAFNSDWYGNDPTGMYQFATPVNNNAAQVGADARIWIGGVTVCVSGGAMALGCWGKPNLVVDPPKQNTCFRWNGGTKKVPGSVNRSVGPWNTPYACQTTLIKPSPGFLLNPYDLGIGGGFACGVSPGEPTFSTVTTMICWGFNEQGQLGDGTTVNRPNGVVVGVKQSP